MIIYQYQNEPFARGHRDGAVQYFEGVHLSKEFAFRPWTLSFFICLIKSRYKLLEAVMHTDDMAAKEDEGSL